MKKVLLFCPACGNEVNIKLVNADRKQTVCGCNECKISIPHALVLAVEEEFNEYVPQGVPTEDDNDNENVQLCTDD